MHCLGVTPQSVHLGDRADVCLTERGREIFRHNGLHLVEANFFFVPFGFDIIFKDVLFNTDYEDLFLYISERVLWF